MEEDLRFADLVLSQGLCSRSQVDECLTILRRLRESGANPAPRLEDLLIEKGYLASGQTARTKKIARSDRGTRISGDSVIPREALEAMGNPLNFLGKYIRVTRLGVGGMGEVWRAWDRELRRWVALKFLRYGNAEEIARFTREAQTAGQLNHPNIASIYEVGDAAGKPFIAMQYIEGQTLVTFPRQDPRLLVTLLRDAALAVHAAHEQRVIHRDLKPHNLMVEGKPGAADPRRLRIFVLDFGLAKQTTVDSSISSSGSILGTPAYMAPEQARGRLHEVDERSDVYSLGATLYEVLADRPPFRGSNAYEILKKVVEEDPKPLRRINPRIDAELETITMKCLEKEPPQRYATALELADDLTRWLDGEAIRAHPPSTAYRLRKFARRHRALLLVTSAAVAIIAAFAGFLLPKYLRERSDRRRTEAALAEQRDREARDRHTRDLARDHLELARRPLEQIPFTRQNARTSRTEIRRLAEHAIAEFRKALDISPEHPEALLGIGRAYEEMDDSRSALDYYIRAVDADPRFAAAIIARLRVHAQMYEESRHSWTGSVLGESQTSNPLLQKIREDRVRLAELKLKTYEESVILAHLAFADGLYADAERHLNDYLTTVPGDRLAAASRTHALLHLGRFVDAEEAAKQHLRLDPQDPVAWFQHAQAIGSHRGRQREAIRDYTEAIRLKADYVQAYLNRGTMHYELEEYPQALEDFNESLRRLPGNPSGYVNRGLTFAAMNRLAEAIADFTTVLQIKAVDEIYYHRGLAYYGKGEYDQAIRDYTDAMALGPKIPKFADARGVAKLAKLDLAGAEQDFGIVIELQPSSGLAWGKRGAIRYKLRRVDAALKDLTEAIRLAPSDVTTTESYYFRGRIHEERSEFEAALSDFDAAIRLLPDHPPPYAYRARIHDHLGNAAAAVRDATRYLELQPDVPGVEELREEMRDILERRNP